MGGRNRFAGLKCAAKNSASSPPLVIGEHRAEGRILPEADQHLVAERLGVRHVLDQEEPVDARTLPAHGIAGRTLGRHPGDHLPAHALEHETHVQRVGGGHLADPAHPALVRHVDRHHLDHDGVPETREVPLVDLGGIAHEPEPRRGQAQGFQNGVDLVLEQARATLGRGRLDDGVDPCARGRIQLRHGHRVAQPPAAAIYRCASRCPRRPAAMPDANPFDLTGKAAIVTGTSRGLGQYFARALARAGADLVITEPAPRDARLLPGRDRGARPAGGAAGAGRARSGEHPAHGRGRGGRVREDRHPRQQRGLQRAQAGARDHLGRLEPRARHQPARHLLRLPGGGPRAWWSAATAASSTSVR